MNCQRCNALDVIEQRFPPDGASIDYVEAIPTASAWRLSPPIQCICRVCTWAWLRDYPKARGMYLNPRKRFENFDAGDEDPSLLARTWRF